jgi:hypothetical protein
VTQEDGLHIRRSTSAETEQERPSVEDLIPQVHVVFRNAGIAVSASKVSRMVRRYKSQVEGNGYGFIDYLANSVAMSEHQRRVVGDELRRVTPYADPTGETAVRNVMRAHRE